VRCAGGRCVRALPRARHRRSREGDRELNNALHTIALTLKRNVNASRARNVDRLAHETRRFLHGRQRQPHLVRGYFRDPHVRYAIM
jgi:hypothetical protein